MFKLTPPLTKIGSWTETVLYDFCSVQGCADGEYPEANLIMDTDGSLVGTTVNGGNVSSVTTGGSPSQGTVFKLAPPAGAATQWTETVLYKFCSQPYCADGSIPASGLTMGRHGVLYGTTQSGGADGGSGTVFKMEPPVKNGGSWTETVVHSFCSLPNCADGSQPNADLIMREDALYGTTGTGPNNAGGTVFKLKP